jgi:hypothetical protein
MTWLAVLKIILQLAGYVARRAERIDIETAVSPNRRTHMANAWMRLLLLAMLCVLARCSPTLSALSGGIDAAKTEQSIAVDVCRAWKPVTYSSRDTRETQLGNRASNAARISYCGKRN